MSPEQFSLSGLRSVCVFLNNHVVPHQVPAGLSEEIHNEQAGCIRVCVCAFVHVYVSTEDLRQEEEEEMGGDRKRRATH